MRSLSQTVSGAGLVLAVFSLGLMAGFFGTYSGNVDLATRELDGATYALVQSAFNRHVRHTLFFVFFFGPPWLCLVALADAWRERPAWWWLVGFIGLGYTLGIVVFTHQVNLPLNRLTESWAPGALPADWALTRDAWNLANDWRAVWNALLFALGLAALSWRAAAVPAGQRARNAHPPAKGLPQ